MLVDGCSYSAIKLADMYNSFLDFKTFSDKTLGRDERGEKLWGGEEG